MQPPMLCMLLRKKLQGAKLLGIEQPALERALLLRFDSVNELGDHVELTLAAEIMGRYSNIILVDENGKIIDALKRVDAGNVLRAARAARPFVPTSAAAG